MEKIKFQSEDGTIEEFYIEEQARINGYNYLLVSDSLGEEAQAYILKDTSQDENQEACYVFVEEEEELEAVSKVFEQMIEDVDLQME